MIKEEVILDNGIQKWSGQSFGQYNWILYCGDSSQAMKDIPSESVMGKCHGDGSVDIKAWEATNLNVVIGTVPMTPP